MALNTNPCQNCGSSHTICYGTYTRSVVDRGKIKKNVKIRRVHCHDCNTTLGVLPKGLQKRKKYTDEAQKEMVEDKRKFRRVFRSEEREFVKGLLAKAGAKFGADSVELVVTGRGQHLPRD